MSRFDFDNDDGCHQITWQMYMHNVNRALASENGKAKLREFKVALEAVPGHRLVDDYIADLEGDVCAIGAYAAYKRTQNGQHWSEATADLNQKYHPVPEPNDWYGRGTVTLWNDQPEPVDAFETQDLGRSECGLNRTLAWYLAYMNDEIWGGTPEQRWQDAYNWVREKLGEVIA